MSPDFAIYLPQADLPTPWGLEILGSGAANNQAGAPYPSGQHPSDHLFDWQRGRVLDEFQIIIITRGSGTLETDRCEPIDIKAPTAFILFPGVWHRYRPFPETGWHERWIAFRGPLANQLLADASLSPEQTAYNVGHNDALLAQFQLIQDEIKSEAFGFRSVAATALMQILALTITLPKRTEEETQPMRNVIRRACFIMRERSTEPLMPEELAAELNIGYTYFRRLFRKYTGLSPKRYHTLLRLQRVKRLLRDTPSSISEISDKLGFNSPFHFSNWFKKETDMSPQHWRQDPKY